MNTITMHKGGLICLVVGLMLGCRAPKEFAKASFSTDPIGDFSAEESKRVWAACAGFPDGTRVGLAIVDGEQVRFAGVAREEGRLVARDLDSAIFEIGSITKVFTAQLLQQLVLEGKIDSLDQLLTSKIDWAFKDNPPITFQQLANHTAGLPSVPASYNPTIFNAGNPYKSYDSLKLKTDLAENLELWVQPGEDYRYSNYGMGLLGSSLGRIAGMSYPQLLQSRIFDPLGMPNSYAEWAMVDQETVQGLNNRARKAPHWEFQALAGAGSALSSPQDLARYAQWSFEHLKGDYAPLARRSFAIDGRMDIGLGWHIFTKRNPAPFLWHNGGTGGFKSCMALDLKRQKAVIILTNIGAINNPSKRQIDALCFNLLGDLQLQK